MKHTLTSRSGLRIASHYLRSRVRSLAGRTARVKSAPILVLGNQKAGTTSIAALLARRAGITATLDLPDLRFDASLLADLHRGRASLADLIVRHRRAFSRDLIKEPHLTLLYPELVRFFPEAQFVFIVRDPRDNIRSILNRLNAGGNDDHSASATLTHPNPLWQLVLDGRPLGIGGASYVERLAERWKQCASIYLDHAPEMHLVRYEDFRDDKVGTVDRLAAALGLPRQNDISDRVDWQYQPRGDRSVPWREFFGTTNLELIEEICREQMMMLNYPSPVSMS